jgi:hypothetical protein
MVLPQTQPAAGRRLVFLHLPKTGGTTLHHHFSAAFAPHEICPERGPHLDRIDPQQLAAYRYFAGHFVFDQLRLIPGPVFIVTVLRPPIDRILSVYHFLKRHTAERLATHPLREAELARASPTLLDFLRNPDPEIQYAIDNTMARNLAGGINLDGKGGYVFPAAGVGIRISELEIMHRATGNLLRVDVLGHTNALADVYARVALAFGMPQIPTLARLNTREEVRPGLEAAVQEAVTPEARQEMNRLTSLDRDMFRLVREHVASRRQ